MSDRNLQTVNEILRDLGYYENRVLEEGDRLIGVKCLRNGCTTFQVGDSVHPILYSTTKKSKSGQPLYEHRGLHVEHHDRAMAEVLSKFKVPRSGKDVLTEEEARDNAAPLSSALLSKRIRDDTN